MYTAKQINVILISCTLFVCSSCTDFYTAVTGLEELLKTEAFVIEYFENYLTQTEMAQEEMKFLFDNIDDKFGVMLDNDTFEKNYQNPLFVIKAMRRLLTDWGKMASEALGSQYAEELGTFLNQFENTSILATQDDLIGAVKGLSRLQETYALSTTEIAEGELKTLRVSDKLSASDCYQFGRWLVELQKYQAAAEWLMQAKVKLTQEKIVAERNGTIPFHDVTDIQILELLTPVLSIIGSHKLARKFNEDLLALDPTNTGALQSISIYETNALADRRRETESVNLKSSTQRTERQDLYEKTCRGELKRDAKEERNLFCRYAHNNVPFCFLARFKMEEMSHDPLVAVYYDVIYNSEIANIRNATESNIERSKVGTAAQASYSDVRTSKQAWLWFEKNEFLKNIHTRLHDITGLSLNSAEALQVANYGIGGHYGPHHDFFPEVTDFGGKGNRILTALFYINHVEMGGATAFPYLRLAVPPIKGSLVMWYNMHESLEVDYRTLHAGCPVLKGSKWICNEWFHELGQEFERPCSLQLMGHKSQHYKDL